MPAARRSRKPDIRAAHGFRNEVSWKSGQGRQPYANRGEQEAEPPSFADEFEAGDRGRYSGANLAQLEQAKGKPQPPPRRQGRP